jgi:chitodextrinase
MNKKLVGVCGRFAVTAFALIIVVLPSAGRASTQSGAVHTFAVQADTYVSANAPSKSYGSQPSLKVDRTPKIAYLRFAVGGIAGPVSGATLRLYAQRSNSTGFDVRGVTNNSWSESSLNYRTAPPAAQQVAGSSGRLTGSAWTSIDVSSLVSGNGTYSFALESSSSSSIVLASKERGSATAAQLVITEATATSADTTPPSAPTNLTASGPTTNSISLSWSASADDTGVAGYRVYRDGTFVTSTAQTSASVSGLSCGTSYGFAVEAYDAADNVSQRTSKSASTSACPDTTAPSAPTSLVKAGSTTSSVLMSWAASTDNVGVAGYTVYVDGTRVGNTTTSYNFTGLACGMSYTFGVEAYDASGNVSPRTTTSASTSPCPSGPRTYYVDSVGGSDLNAGTSDTSAWKTLAKPNTASLAPGDRLLFKRGDVWTGSLKITASGNSASPITVGAYGTGNLPVIQGPATSCVVLAGSYLTVSGVQADGCSWAGAEILGANDRVEQSVLSHNVAGVDVKAGSVGAKVLDNQILDNNKMSVLTPSPTNDDSGAFGVALHGDGAEVAYNRISGSDAFSYDYGRDGAAVEVYGGQGNNVHHNVAVDNHDFSELGNPRSADNTFAYNLVRSSLAGSTFLVTRGGASSLGPVTHTRVYNNTVYLSGSSSQGFVCYAGCSPDILTLRDNIIQAVWKVGYADAPFDENDDLFYKGKLQFRRGRRSLVTKPRFVAPPSNLRLRRGSPAIDRGVDLGYRRDLAGRRVPLDGDGNGRAAVDLGAYEYGLGPGRR